MVARDILLAEADRRAIPRRPHLHAPLARWWPTPRRGPAGDLRGHAAPLLPDRRRHGALRQQLQDEAAAALGARSWTRWSKASSRALSTPSPPTTPRTPAARRCRSSSTARSASSASRPRWRWRWRNWFTPAGFRWRGWSSCSPPGRPRFWARPRQAGTGRARRRHHLHPDLSWTYDVNRSFSKSRNSPFDGRTFRGGPVATVVNGVVVWRRETA